MKLHKFLFIPAAFIAVILFSSCSDDNTTNNPPASNVLFSQDTLSASVNAGSTGISTDAAGFSQTITATQVKIEYSLQSNADSSFGASGSYRDSTNGTPIPPSPLTINVYGPVDTTYSFTYNVASQPFHAGFNVTMNVTQPNAVTRYIRLTNIKVTKLQ